MAGVFLQEVLTGLVPGDIEVFGVDAKRLRDERDPINAGDEALFVATAKFRISRTPKSTTVPYPKGAKILEVRDDADWVSLIDDDQVIRPKTVDEKEDPTVSTVEHLDEVEDWLRKHWDFRFYINGEDEPVRAAAGDPPWVLRVDTSLLDGEYLRIEADIVALDEADPEEQPVFLDRRILVMTNEDGTIELSIFLTGVQLRQLTDSGSQYATNLFFESGETGGGAVSLATGTTRDAVRLVLRAVQTTV